MRKKEKSNIKPQMIITTNFKSIYGRNIKG